MLAIQRGGHWNWIRGWDTQPPSLEHQQQDDVLLSSLGEIIVADEVPLKCRRRRIETPTTPLAPTRRTDWSPETDGQAPARCARFDRRFDLRYVAQINTSYIGPRRPICLTERATAQLRRVSIRRNEYYCSSAEILTTRCERVKWKTSTTR